ncbi:MGDG synthase family glycosyltransferase [Nocardia xishanensis]
MECCGRPSSSAAVTGESAPRTVLVLYLALGGGHRSSAEAIADTLRVARPDFDVRVVDAATVVFPGLGISSVLARAYSFVATAFGGRMHFLIYTFADSWPRAITYTANLAFGREFGKYIDRVRPVAVVSTFSVVSAIAAERLEGSDIPTISIVTDAGRVNKIWTVGNPVKILTADPATIPLLRADGVEVSNYKYVGPVVHRMFADPPSRKSARDALGIAPDRFTVLLNVGLLPPRSGLRKFVQSIVSRDVPVQMIVRTDVDFGCADENIIVRRSQRAIQLDGMSAADLIVGKSGWVTLNEAIAVGRPVLIIDAIPGQEEQNTHYALRFEGAIALRPSEAAELVVHLAMSDRSSLPLRWSDVAVSAALNGSDSAVAQILEIIDIYGEGPV